MSVSEEARHELYLALEEAHGRARATTLMELLPPVGWADVATRRDLDHLEERIDLRFQRVHDRFDAVDQRFEAVDRRFDAVDQRFASIDRRFASIDRRFASIEHRLGLVESGIAGQRGQLWKMFAMLVGLQLTAATVIIAFQQLP